jgi:hypothetical protein
MEMFEEGEKCYPKESFEVNCSSNMNWNSCKMVAEKRKA